MPSFAHGLGSVNNIVVMLEVSGVDITRGLKLQRGYHSIYFESESNESCSAVAIGKE